MRPENTAHTRAPPITSGTRWRAVGELGDRHLQRERGDAGEGDEAEHGRQVEAEGVADLGQEDAERRAVELVDGVEAGTG